MLEKVEGVVQEVQNQGQIAMDQFETLKVLSIPIDLPYFMKLHLFYYYLSSDHYSLVNFVFGRCPFVGGYLVTF